MASTANAQAETLDNFIAGWKKGTAEGMTTGWSDDCKQVMLPSRLGIPPKTFAEVQAVLPVLMSTLSNYKLDIYQVVHDAAKRKAAIYAKSTADTPFDDFNWNMEYAVFLTFSEEGKHIEKYEEMLDTALFQEFFPKFQKYLGERQTSH